jgi:hypothetical protein
MAQVVIARWESQRGKDWVEVYEQTFGDGVAGYGYNARLAGGWMGGNVTRDQALAKVQRLMDMGCFCSQKSPMRKVV